MAHMTHKDFEERYRQDPDPWDYEQSDYEHNKYVATLAACGHGPFANGLELGGSIGVFTEMLAPCCRALTTVDVARTAAAMARRRLADFPHVRVIRGAIPDAVPDEQFDLIVASEILYYLPAGDLDRTLDLIRDRLITGGRLVAVHWRPPGQERPFTATEVHARLRDAPWLTPVQHEEAEAYLLDAMDRR